MHGLKADGIATDVGFTLLADKVALMPIGRVDLHSRLRGIDFHGEFGFIVVNPCDGSAEQCFVTAFVTTASSSAFVMMMTQIVSQLIAVVVTARHAELEVVIIYAVANG